MLLFLLFLILLLFTVHNYLINNRDILSASFISCSIYDVAVLVALLNYSNWGVSYSFYFVFVIFISLSAIFVGEFICKTIMLNNYPSRVVIKREDPLFNRKIVLNRTLSIILLIIGIITSYLYLKETIELAYANGYNGTGYLMEYVRNVYLFGKYDKNYLIIISAYFQTGVAYVSLFTVIVNTFIDIKQKSFSFYKWLNENFLYILLMMPYLFCTILSSGRTGIMLYVCIIFFMILVMLYRSELSKNIKISYFINNAIKCIVIFLIAFMFLGLLTGKTQKSSILDTISTYIGSSIPGLNEYLKDAKVNNNEFGLNTFYGIRTFLNRFGANLNLPQMYRSDIIFPNNGGTNLYTSIRSYYADFGLIGVFIFNFLLGYLLTIMEYKAKNPKQRWIWILIYTYYGYFLIRQVFAESFISYILTTTRIFEIGSIYICFTILIRKTEMIAKRK